MIPYGRQEITQADIDRVVEVLRSDYLTQGPVVPAFERAVAEHVHAEHAVAVNSATSALHLACLALGLGPGGLLWTSPVTFVASANCALHCGADVDFVDIDPETGNLSPDALEKKLIAARAAGRLPDIVIPVHLAGQSCDMQAISRLADHFGVRVIEDASHAVGATYRGEPVGCCRYSDVCIFSFHPVKIITTGEGGMALTNDKAVARRMELLRSHGITRSPGEMTHAPDGPWYYQQIALGFNFRMTDLHAALGISQLARLRAYVDRRHVLAARYDRLLDGLPVRPLRQCPDGRSSFHLYVVRVLLSGGACSRDALFAHLRASGIGVNLHYIPVYLQPWYRQIGFARGLCPEAEAYYAQAVTLPLHPSLTDAQQDHVVASLREAAFQ